MQLNPQMLQALFQQIAAGGGGGGGEGKGKQPASPLQRQPMQRPDTTVRRDATDTVAGRTTQHIPPFPDQGTAKAMARAGVPTTAMMGAARQRQDRLPLDGVFDIGSGPVHLPDGMSAGKYLDMANELGIIPPHMAAGPGYVQRDTPAQEGELPFNEDFFKPGPQRVVNFENPNFALPDRTMRDPINTVWQDLRRQGFPRVQEINAIPGYGKSQEKSKAIMDAHGMYEPGAYGQTSMSYADLMVDSYGRAQAERLINALRKLYQDNAGGAMAEFDIQKQIPVIATLREQNKSGNQDLTKEPPPIGAVTGGKPDTAQIMWNYLGDDDKWSEYAQPGLLPSEQARRAIPEEVGHVMGIELGSNPENPWSRYQRHGAGQGLFGRRWGTEGTTKPPHHYVMKSGGLYPKGYKPPQDDSAVKAQQKTDNPEYLGNLEEIRAKFVDMAQQSGKHPLLHDDGLDAGIDALFDWMGTQNTNSTRTPSDLREIHEHWKGADPASKERMREILRVIFTNFADVGVALPETQQGGVA